MPKGKSVSGKDWSGPSDLPRRLVKEKYLLGRNR